MSLTALLHGKPAGFPTRTASNSLHPRANATGYFRGIKLINPEDLEKYVNWHEIGTHLLSRALEAYRIWRATLHIQG